jgi:hypothetical protein
MVVGIAQLNCYRAPPELAAGGSAKPSNLYLYSVAAIAGGMKLQCPAGVAMPAGRLVPERRARDWFEVDITLCSDLRSSDRHIHALQRWASVAPIDLLQVWLYVALVAVGVHAVVRRWPCRGVVAMCMD